MTEVPSRNEAPAHVVFVLAGLAMGGAEAQLVAMLEAGADRAARHRVTVLTLTTARDASLVDRLVRLGVRIETVDRAASGFPAFFLRLARWFRRERPDLVHTVLSGSAGTWGRLTARLAGVRAIIHSERSLGWRGTRLQRRLEPLAHRVTTRVLTNARAVEERLLADGVPCAKLLLIRNGVDLERFSAVDGASLRRSWGIADGGVVAGFLGMLRPEKRPDLLLDALSELREADRPDMVAIAGDGPLMPEIRARIEADAWADDHVRLLGIIADTPAFLAAIDVLVLTSDTEGLPNAIIEAMAAGVPCIATRVSDVPDLVTDNGFVVDAGDVQGLADALGRMRRMDPEERRELGRRGALRAEAEFDLQTAASRFWDAHDEVMRVRRRADPS